MYQSFIYAMQTHGDFAKVANLPSEPKLRTNLITHHHTPWGPSEKASLWVAGSQPLDGLQRSAVLCGELGWKAARPGVARKRRIELRSPRSAARVPRGLATRSSPPEAGSRRRPLGTPGGGEQAASRNDSRDSPASQRDLTVSCGRSSCREVPAPRGARASGSQSLLSAVDPASLSIAGFSATCGRLASPRLLPGADCLLRFQRLNLGLPLRCNLAAFVPTPRKKRCPTPEVSYAPSHSSSFFNLQVTNICAIL